MLSFLFIPADKVVYEEDALRALADNAGEVVAASRDALQQVSAWQTENIQQALSQTLVEGMGIKPRFAFTPLRVAVSGRRVSPPLFESMELLGKAETMLRLERFAQQLDS